MADLLSFLRDEGVSLIEAELPGGEELRPIVGALVKRLERLEEKVIGELKPAPEKEPVVQPDVAHSVQPGPPPEPAPAPPAQGITVTGTATSGNTAIGWAPPPQAEPAQTLDEAKAELEAAQARVDELEKAESADQAPEPSA